MLFIFDSSWNLRVLWGFFNKSWVERYIQLSFTHVCNYLNQSITRISEKNGKSFKGVSKTKNGKKKTHTHTHEETEFHNSIQDWVFTTAYRLKENAWKNAWMWSFDILNVKNNF